MTIALGIDTGGTYTDAALVEHASGHVLCSAKALTTRHDLALGIGAAIDTAFRQPGAPRPGDVGLVALSTTLATNAIVEGQGSPICLILIGYDPQLIRQYGFEEELVTDEVVYVAGGHDIHGNEAQPLDEESLRRAVLERQARVEAFAVSGYFGVRNPAHEERARELIEALSGLPVTCGHDLTTRLNSVRRATTVALNARLVPLLRELIITLRHTLGERHLSAPLMVVKGDGSLVRAEWAMRRPIETILSGPAASAVGAWHLAGLTPGPQDGSLWAVDMGGTTTDIAALRGGQPRLSAEGAQIGRWRTMVEAVDVHTVGLGGDSHVRVDAGRHLKVGPQRVIPLSLLASQHPEILEDLWGQTVVPPRDEVMAQFLVARRPPARPLEEEETALIQRLARGPVSLATVVRGTRYGVLALRRVEQLVAEQLALRAGFTPTDALHVLGRLNLWNSEAAALGAQILAAQARRPVADFCNQVIESVSQRAAAALISKVLSDESHLPQWDREPTAALLLERALNDGDAPELGLACDLKLRYPLVAIGAPVEAYMPRVAQRLHTRLIIPPHAEVANAVGAVAGGVVQRQRVLITPLEPGTADGCTLRLHLPDGVHDFHEVEAAVAYAQERMEGWMDDLARQVGAAQVEVQMARKDRNVPIDTGWGDQLYLGSELIFTAVGRPSPAVEVGAWDAPRGGRK